MNSRAEPASNWIAALPFLFTGTVHCLVFANMKPLPQLAALLALGLALVGNRTMRYRLGEILTFALLVPAALATGISGALALRPPTVPPTMPTDAVLAGTLAGIALAPAACIAYRKWLRATPRFEHRALTTLLAALATVALLHSVLQVL